ncbi:hypothetical protein R50073_28910 [Maricurvus nonylphenolicus]|uniref:hypothetical protein n=1 Tax=Maricurvus nonylphenolicus TaxID=1008307 RepID=UPI0036F324D1
MIECGESLVHIRLNQRRLLLPLDRHFSLETLSALEVTEGHSNSQDRAVGYVYQPQGRHPVYQLDDQWRLLRTLDYGEGNKQAGILQMRVEGHTFGLVCFDLTILPSKDIELLRLPQVMCTADGLVSHVWINKQQAVGLVFPADVYRYLIGIGAAEIDAAHQLIPSASRLTQQPSLFGGG